MAVLLLALLAVLFWLYCPRCPVPVVWLSFSVCPPCPGCPFPAVLTRLACPGYPVPGVLFLFCPCPCSGRPVFSIMSRLYYPDCPMAALPRLFFRGPVPAVLSKMSCSAVPPLRSFPSCPAQTFFSPALLSCLCCHVRIVHSYLFIPGRPVPSCSGCPIPTVLLRVLSRLFRAVLTWLIKN
jgi:hypothetical protein